MINSILKNSCYEIKRRIGVTHNKLKGRPLLPEAELCYNWMQQRLQVIENEVKRIEILLNKNISDVVLQQTWYSELSTLSNQLSFLDQYFLNALYRLKPEDQFALKLLHWLHKSHPQTADKAFIITNGVFSMASSPTTPTIYFLPVTSEASFLHMPLFFHEYGHQLFQCHRIDLENLIGELQTYIAECTKPVISQDDEKYKKYEERAAEIVETWREWMEEFFCDAVGLTIGGPSYLHAFSQFTLMGGTKEFFVPGAQLAKRSHPVTLLRIRFLVERAKRLGWIKEANALENRWDEMAKLLGVKEDYFGYYEYEYKETVISILDDMLEEANPILYVDALLSDGSYLPLIDEVWNKYQMEPSSFENWEKSHVRQIATKLESLKLINDFSSNRAD